MTEEVVERSDESAVAVEDSVTAETTKMEDDKGSAAKSETPTAVEPIRPSTPPPILTTSGKKRPPYKYDPNKVTLRFIFANHDGLAVTIECRRVDTVGDVKHALLSVWPEGLPVCDSGERLRLICMGKGILSPDSLSLEGCQIPVFQTHPTPINVSIKPNTLSDTTEKNHIRNAGASHAAGANNSAATAAVGGAVASQGCACAIL